ncbi:MAG: potassium channel family protein [Planctomycetota bacterium]
MNEPIDQLRPLTPLQAHGALTLMVLQLFVAPYAMREHGSVSSIVTQTGFHLFLVLIVLGVSTHRLQLGLCIALVAVATGLQFIAPQDLGVIRALASLCLVGCGVIALIMSIRRVLLTRHVTLALLSASASIYLLAGVVWAIGYQAIEAITPGAFASSGASQPDDAGTLFYFSFVTLTTLGYGDVSPVTPIARSAAIAEAVFGQLFLVLLIGRLVSLHIMATPERTAA